MQNGARDDDAGSECVAPAWGMLPCCRARAPLAPAVVRHVRYLPPHLPVVQVRQRGGALAGPPPPAAARPPGIGRGGEADSDAP